MSLGLLGRLFTGIVGRSTILTHVLEKFVSGWERRFAFATCVFNRPVDKMDILDTVVIIVAVLLNAFMFVRTRII